MLSPLRAGLGNLSSIAVKYLGLEGRYAQIYEKILMVDFLVDIKLYDYAIMLSLKVIGLKNRKFGGFSLDKEVPKTILSIRDHIHSSGKRRRP